MATTTTTKKKKRKKKNKIPVWVYAGCGVLVVGIIVLILFLTGVFGGGSSEGDTSATDMLTEGGEVDPAALLTPEQAEIFEQIAADYLYISKDGEYNTEAPYDSIMIFNDATASLYLTEYEEFDDFYPVTYEDGNITIRVADKTWTGTLADGVMTLQMDDGSSRVYAADTTQLYETWMAEVGGEDVSVVEGLEGAGYYRLTAMNDGNGDVPAAEIAPVEGETPPDNYLVLEEDGTGYMSFMYSVEELTWDETTLWFDYDWEEYALEGDTLTLTYGGDGSLTFAKSTETPPAKPEITDAEGVILVKNSTGTYFDEILFVPGTMSFEDSGYWSSIGPDETVELDLYETGGKLPGRFDMAVYEMETDRTSFVRYLELYDGYDIELKEEGGGLSFVVRDTDGNTRTYPAEIMEGSSEEEFIIEEDTEGAEDEEP